MRTYALFDLIILLASGCSRSPEGGTVTGMVYLDGKPLTGAVMRFWPKDDLTLDVYGGKTDENGKIVLNLRDNKLMKPGKYVVLVAKQATRKTGTSSKTEEEQMSVVTGFGGFQNVLPERYSDRAQSPLIVEIHNGVNELQPLELKTR